MSKGKLTDRPAAPDLILDESDHAPTHDRLPKENYDLSFLNTVLGVYAGAAILSITLDESKWLYPYIIWTLLGSVAVTTIPIVIAINQKTFLWRAGFELLAILSGYLTVFIVLWVSAHDIGIESRTRFWAFATGVMIWVLVRETTIFLLTILTLIRDLLRQRLLL
jgi:hypothetical protein